MDHRKAIKQDKGYGGERAMSVMPGFGAPAVGQYQRVRDPNDPQNFGRDTQYHGVVPAPTAQKNVAYEPYARGAI